LLLYLTSATFGVLCAVPRHNDVMEC